MESVQKELFVKLCELLGLEEGKNFFMNRLPNTNELGDESVAWLIENDGIVTRQFTSHTKTKEYTCILYYRHQKPSVVDKKICEIEQIINHVECFALPSYIVTGIQAVSFSSGIDTDNEKFYRGTVTIRLGILDNYEKT